MKRRDGRRAERGELTMSAYILELTAYLDSVYGERNGVTHMDRGELTMSAYSLERTALILQP